MPTIAQWGTGAGIHLPKELLRMAKLKIGDVIRFDVQKDGIKIIPERQSNSEKIEALFANYQGDTRCHEVEWGDDVGREKIT